MTRILPFLLVLLLAAAACGGGDEASLPGSSWTLTSLDGAEPVGEKAITLAFADDGTLAGTSGCNQYGGGFTVDGDALTVEPLRSTRMACEDDVMAQEFAYTTALEAAQSFSIDGDTLEIVSSEGTLTFAAA
ncbi:MAG: META domain-containing protein [Gaiellales bacterium]